MLRFSVARKSEVFRDFPGGGVRTKNGCAPAPAVQDNVKTLPGLHWRSQWHTIQKTDYRETIREWGKGTSEFGERDSVCEGDRLKYPETSIGRQSGLIVHLDEEFFESFQV